jgi:hypothetical protein
MGDQHDERPLPTQDNKNTEQTQIDIHASSGIRTTIPVLEQVKTFHALDRATTVIGRIYNFGS